MSDLVERLRLTAHNMSVTRAEDIKPARGLSLPELLREAADALERAEKERDEARAYLKQITLMAGPTIPRYENALNIIRDIKHGAARVLSQPQG